MALILHQSSSHGHAHSHGLAPQHGPHGGQGNTSVRAAFIHVVGDLLQSVGVLVAAITIHFWVGRRPVHTGQQPESTDSRT